MLCFKGLNAVVFGMKFFTLLKITNGPTQAFPRTPSNLNFSHFAWATQSRKVGELGLDPKLPLIADRNMNL